MNKHISPEELEHATAVQSPLAAPAKSPRKKLFAGFAGALILGGGGFFAYETMFAGKHVSTDNAYVDAETAQVTALTSGPVAEVKVRDTQAVKKGDVLVVLDDVDRRLELAQALAALDQIERKVRSLGATDNALSGQVGARQADLASARADLARAQAEYQRRQPLAASGAVSGEELTTVQTQLQSAQAAVQQAQANLSASQGSLQANSVLISGVSVEENPEVKAARTRVELARVALERTVVRAPIDGVVAKRNVQAGQMVQAGTPLMIVVPVQSAYVNANFKEVQLRDVRPGQHVELESDLYGSKVVYHGRVVGFSGGTGSAFAVVPAQNATGNWIKVVQRLPVRISLDPKELQAHPLKVGLSMKATIDVSE
ncbi:MAG: HlyD family secretion protein [Brevundimonas sp.]